MMGEGVLILTNWQHKREDTKNKIMTVRMLVS